MNGQTSCLWDECNLYCGDQTKSQKDTDAIINEIVLNLLTTMNGEKHCVLVFDCGPLNTNAAVAMALPKLLTKLGLFETRGCVFLQLHHSKVGKILKFYFILARFNQCSLRPSLLPQESCDRFFGLVKCKFRAALIFGLEALGRLAADIQSSQESGAHLRLLRLNPMAMSSFKEMMAKRYQPAAACSPPPRLHFADMQWHYFFAVHADSAKGDLARANVEVDVFGDGETCSLHELLGPLLPEKAHHHDSPRRDVFLLRGDSGVPSSELHDLYTSHSTVAQKKAAEVAAVGAKRARPATAPSAAAARKAA